MIPPLPEYEIYACYCKVLWLSYFLIKHIKSLIHLVKLVFQPDSGTPAGRGRGVPSLMGTDRTPAGRGQGNVPPLLGNKPSLMGDKPPLMGDRPPSWSEPRKQQPFGNRGNQPQDGGRRYR